MGNTFSNGKARVHDAAIPFIGLSANSIRGLRHAFNDQLEGFGVSKNKLVDMCSILSEQMAASENLDLENKRLQRATKLYFKLLDTDRNKLIDAIGCLSGLAMVSSMRRIEKLIFIMELFDFAQLNKLTSDECAMAMITGCGAVAVITSTASPSQEVIETIAWRAFDHEGLDPTPSTNMDVIPIRSMATHLMSNNDALAYINHCHNIVGSQSVIRQDEMPMNKVCPKLTAEKQLTWFDADTEDKKRDKRNKQHHQQVDSEEASSNSNSDSEDIKPSDMTEIHAEQKDALLVQLHDSNKKRKFRTNKTTRTWMEMVDDGDVEPSYHQQSIEKEKARQQQLRADAGGYDAEQEDAENMSKAQAAHYAMSHAAHTFRLKHIHGMPNAPGTHTHVHYLNRG